MDSKPRFLSHNCDVQERLGDELFPCYFGWDFCRPGQQFGPHTRGRYLIHFITSGRGWYQVGGRTFSLSANDAFLIRPGETTTYHADEKDPWTYYFFSFHGTRAAAFISQTRFGDDQPTIRLPDLTLAHLIEETALQSVAVHMPPLFELSALLQMLLCFMDPEAQAKRSPVESYIQRAESYIRIHCGEDISVCWVASILSLNRSHFCRIFRQTTGQTPSEYLLACRIENACHLLAGTQLPVDEIARSSGFNSCAYFYRTFKQHTGKRPGEYRRACAAEHRQYDATQ